MARIAPVLLATLAVAMLPAGPASAQTNGFNKTGAGPYDYCDTANWVGGAINGIWDSSLTLTANQTVTFGADTNIATGLTFANVGSYNLILKGTGGNRTLTLGGDIYASPAGNAVGQVTLGGAENEKLNIDLGGATRTVYVHYVYSSAYDTLCVTNVVGSGGMNKTGSGYLRLYGDNTFADGLTLNAGHLSLGHNNAAGTGTLTINGGRIYGYGPDSSYTVTNAVEFGGDFQWGSSSSSAKPLDLSGVVTLATSTVEITRMQNAKLDKITGAISDGGSNRVLYVRLSKDDLGANFYLSGNNTFGGGLKVESSNAGGGNMSLYLDHDNAAGGGAITLMSGSLSTSAGTRNITNRIDIQGHATYRPSLSCGGDAMNLNGNLRIVGMNGQFFAANVKVTLNGNVEDDGADRDLTMDQTTGVNVGMTLAGALAMRPGSRFLVVGNATYQDKLIMSGSGKTHTGRLVASTLGKIDLTGSNNTFSDKVSINGGTFTLTGTNNTFSGGLELNSGTLKIAGDNAIASGTLTINGGTVQSDSATDRILATPVIIAGSCALGGGNYGSLTFSGQTTLTGTPVLTANPKTGGTVTFSNLTGAGSLGKAGDGTLVLPSSEMSYQGPTEVWEGTLQVPAAGTLGSNLIVRLYGGTLEANAADNFRAGQKVYLCPASTNAVMPVLALAYNGIPEIDSSSRRSVIAVNTTNYTAVTNLQTLGDGSLWLGSTAGGTITAANLQPGGDNTWRLGGGGGALVLDAASGAALTNSANLVVGRNGGGLNFMNTTALNDANTFDGGITVNCDSKLTGWMQTSGNGSPFGANTASNPVVLNGGILELTTNGSASAIEPVSLGALAFTGGGRIYLKGTSGAAADAKARLHLDSVTRDPTYRAGLTIYGQNNGLGTNELLYVANPGAELAMDSANMAKPYYVVRTSSSKESFVTNGTDGLKPRGFTKTTIAAAGPDDLVEVTGNETINSDTTIHALRMQAGSMSGNTVSGSGTLNIRSGGIIAGSSSTSYRPTISCAVTSGAELVVAVMSAGWLTMSGDIRGTNGITKLGPLLLLLTQAATNSFTGPITVAEGTLQMTEDRCLGMTNNTLVLNGGGLYFNANSPTVLRQMIIGPNGGWIDNTSTSHEQWFNGPIAGPGLLRKGGAGKGITFGGIGNTWSGGFLMTAGKTTVTAGSSLGTGDVTLTGGTLILNGSANIVSTATVALGSAATVNMTDTAAPYRIGSLAGGGNIALGPSSGIGTVTLEAGGNGNSTLFSGAISDSTSNGKGALTKVGAGTLALLGASTYSGGTLVSNGTLLVNGSLGAGTAVTTESGGTLGGLGTIYSDVVIQSGATLAPGDSGVGTLTVGNLALAEGCTNRFDMDGIDAYDKVVVNGDLALAGVFSIAAQPGRLGSGNYEIMSYTGTLTTGTTSVQIPAPYMGRIETNTANKVYLRVTPGGTVITIW